MRIEIDTKHDTKEELAHLSNMLKALAGSPSSSSVMDSRIERKLARKGLMDQAPAASSPEPASGGIFNLFNEESSAPAAPAPSAAPLASSGDMFSLFNSDPAPQQAAPQPVQPYGESMSAFDILNNSSTPEAEETDEKPTTVKELLEDDRIVPY